MLRGINRFPLPLVPSSPPSLLNSSWPDAHWDVSGIFSNDLELAHIHDYFLKYFGIQLFTLVHGSPLLLWNSGRVLPHLIRSAREIEQCLNTWFRRNVAIDLTFSNPYIHEDHLKLPLGNDLLQIVEANNPTGNNGVIMSSDLFYEYVRTKYPGLKTVSSILKVTMERGGGKLDYYLRLADQYDKVMVHPDDNTNYDLLEKLEDKSKFEILVNENCTRQCPIRRKHYDSLSKTSLNFLGYGDSFEELRLNNACSHLDVLMGNGPHCTTQLSRQEMRRLYEMGFRQFKIQGRGLSHSGAQILDILRLMLNDDRSTPDTMAYAVMKCLESFGAMPPHETLPQPSMP